MADSHCSTSMVELNYDNKKYHSDIMYTHIMHTSQEPVQHWHTELEKGPLLPKATGE